MAKLNVTKVIILRESVLASIVKDLVTFATIVSVIGAGVLMRSSAMQWLGFIVLLLVMVGRRRGQREMTPQQAANWLAQECGVRGRDA